MRRRMTSLCVLFLLCLLVGLALRVNTAHAAGYAIQEQSGVGLGQAFAGVSAGLGDGSSAWYNPAAMTLLEDNTVSAGINTIIPSSQFRDEGSNLPALGGIPLAGGSGGDGGEIAFVPNLYYVHQATDAVSLGLSVNSPFGLQTEYRDGWIGRYHALQSSLMNVNINPSLGWEITDWLSVGAGASAVYADATLTNAIDFGTIAFGTLGPATATALGLTPQAVDGEGRVEGDDWGVGGNAGMLFSFGDTRLGVHYRSKVDLKLKGTGRFTVPTAALPLTTTGSFVDTGASAEVSLPETVSSGLYHHFNDQWAVAFEALWTHWTRFDELRIKFDSNQQDSVTEEGWDDNWRFAGAVNYSPNETSTYRLGVAYEETPISDAEHRTPRIPDHDRWWASAGVTFELMENVDVNLSYAHIFVSEADSNTLSSTGALLAGEYDLNTDLINLQVIAYL